MYCNALFFLALFFNYQYTTVYLSVFGLYCLYLICYNKKKILYIDIFLVSSILEISLPALRFKLKNKNAIFIEFYLIQKIQSLLWTTTTIQYNDYIQVLHELKLLQKRYSKLQNIELDILQIQLHYLQNNGIEPLIMETHLNSIANDILNANRKIYVF